MRAWGRYLICGAAGILLGASGAVWTLRVGAMATGHAIGPWTTRLDIGAVRTSAYTRAVVAVRDLLALPAAEARYYSATVDNAGQPLDGRCRYRVSGVGLPTEWWSLTLYDPSGDLVANKPGIYSLGSAALPSSDQARWTIIVAPDEQAGYWLPTGGVHRFELILRAYVPDDGGKGDFARSQLPVIVREDCA